MARECITHHHACDCREERFRELEAENERLRTKLDTSQVALKGAEERAKMLLDAKSHWAERARTAESRLDCYVDGVRALLTEWDQLDDMEQNRRLLEIHQRADAVVVERSVPKGDRFTGTDCDFYEPGNGNACMNCGTMHGSE